MTSRMKLFDVLLGSEDENYENAASILVLADDRTSAVKIVRDLGFASWGCAEFDLDHLTAVCDYLDRVLTFEEHFRARALLEAGAYGMWNGHDPMR